MAVLSHEADPSRAFTHRQQGYYVPYSVFFAALPKARAIYNEHKQEYRDGYSKWIGRWIKGTDTYTRFHTHLPSHHFNQIFCDRLIHTLVTEILASPFDRSPFAIDGDKMPILFKGLPYPHWLLKDIFTLLGSPERIEKTKLHSLMHEMLVWIRSLCQQPAPNHSESSSLAIRTIAGSIIATNPTAGATYLNSARLISLNCHTNLNLSLRKLHSYRKLIQKAYAEMALRNSYDAIEKQTKQIARVTVEQKTCAKWLRIQNSEMRISHEKEMKQSFNDIGKVQAATQNIIDGHRQAIIDELSQAEQKMKELLQDCKNKEDQLQALKDAQKNLRQ